MLMLGVSWVIERGRVFLVWRWGGFVGEIYVCVCVFQDDFNADLQGVDA